MMRDTLKITSLLLSLMFSTSVSAYSIDLGETDVGGLDSVINQTILGNSGNEELDWIQDVLGTDYSFGDKYEDGSLNLIQTYESPLIFAHELETSPAYFLIKIGGGDWNGDTHFLFQNETEAAYGVFSLEQFLKDCVEDVISYDYKGGSKWGYKSRTGGCQSGCNIELDRVSHIAPITTSVPEPGAIALLSLGLIGMYAARRRKTV